MATAARAEEVSAVEVEVVSGSCLKALSELVGATVLVGCRLKSGVLGRVGIFVSDCEAGKLGVGGSTVAKIDGGSVDGRGEVYGKCWSRGRCELNAVPRPVEARWGFCAVVFAFCKCGFETTIIENAAVRRRLFLSSTVLAFFKPTLKFLCFLALFIDSFSKLCMYAFSSSGIGGSVVQNPSDAAVFPSLVVACGLAPPCNRISTKDEETKNAAW